MRSYTHACVRACTGLSTNLLLALPPPPQFLHLAVECIRTQPRHNVNKHTHTRPNIFTSHAAAVVVVEASSRRRFVDGIRQKEGLTHTSQPDSQGFSWSVLTLCPGHLTHTFSPLPLTQISDDSQAADNCEDTHTHTHDAHTLARTSQGSMCWWRWSMRLLYVMYMNWSEHWCRHPSPPGSKAMIATQIIDKVFSGMYAHVGGVHMCR